MRTAVLACLVGLSLVFGLPGWLASAFVHAQADANVRIDPTFFKDMRYRQVGPPRGGRVTAVAGHRREPSTFYMGATGGGVWKTTDYGLTWTNVSDGFFATGSIGAIEVAESDLNVVYVGTGSSAIRSNVVRGRGVYKSTDGGKNWTFVGLRNAGQIGAIRVDPRDANVAYVAALGQAFGPNEERGVFRTKDGGKTWVKSLFINQHTGVVSLAMNPANPAELYAGAWHGERRPWTIVSGGPASEGGIYKTANGGDTWTHLANGLPQDLVGKVGVDVSPANPQRVYAILEAPGGEAGVYRSDDAGGSFAQVSSQASLIARPFYYTYIDADPKSADTVWVNNLALWKSTDAGRTWRAVPTPHGDNHGMWINPDNPDIFIQSNDGGANVTQNGGRTWSSILNQPTSEIYQVAVDDRFPYRLYGAQQDNTTVIVPSLPPTALGVDDPNQLWTEGPGCETGPIAPKIDDPAIVYGACKGEFSRMNMRNGNEQQRWVWPQNRYGHAATDMKFRFQRVSPLELSPHDPKVIYYCSNVVHRTTNEGVTWDVISPDLTAHEPDKQGISGGPITRDITGEEVYSTIYAFRESPREKGVLWAGANDGPVHVSRDAGKTWTKVTPGDLPPGGRVQNIEISPFRNGSAYIAVYRYLLDDWQPYIYETDDYGKTWTRLTTGRNGIPADYPTRVVREDPDAEGLLYAGTEFGLFISFDNGGHWQTFQQNLPVTPVTDIRVHQRDLVLSTMGRSFWIMDDLEPLHEIAATLRTRAGDVPPRIWGAHLFTPRPAYRLSYRSPGTRPSDPQYPPPGAVIDYYFEGEPTADVTVSIADSNGKTIRTYSTAAQRADVELPASPRAGSDLPPRLRVGSDLQVGTDQEEQPRRGRSTPVRLTKTAGMHRFVWDLRYDNGGPLAVPGTYQVTLAAGSWSETRQINVQIDPRVAADGVTQADLEEQLELALRLRAAITEARALAMDIRTARDTSPSAATPLPPRGAPPARERSSRAQSKTQLLDSLYARLVTGGGAYPQPMLIDQLSSTYRMVTSADMKVGRSAFDYFDELRRELADTEREFRALAGGR